jgi:hypothetical protein
MLLELFKYLVQSSRSFKINYKLLKYFICVSAQKVPYFCFVPKEHLTSNIKELL